MLQNVISYNLFFIKRNPGFPVSMQVFVRNCKHLPSRKNVGLLDSEQRSIVNHLYWCVASSPSGDGEMVMAKWLSLDHHVHNIHCGHSEPFPNCAHGELDPTSRKKWFKRRKKTVSQRAQFNQ